MTDNSQADDKIRKVYVKDLKRGEPVQTVFKALKKERHASRSGKTFLALTLVDRTGEIDARVFENVDAAEMLFAIGDYLLVEGKVGSFHGKSQVVIDRLERLDPGPIEAAEFAWEPPPAPAEPAPAAAAPPPERASQPESAHRQARARLLKLLDDPAITLGLDALLRHLERELEERVTARLSGQGPRVEKRPRPEPRPRHEPRKDAREPRAEPKRDPTLPEGLAFKPFTALVPEPGSSSTGGES